jgi:hypothetical protein
MASFLQLLSSFDADPGRRGKQFERFVKWFLINDPEWSFTDYYGEQSCTAGRASFITGQSGLRTGMTKVGLPGATTCGSSTKVTSLSFS